MSIYCTILDIGGDHKNSCARLRRIGKGLYEQNDSRPCTCGEAPLVYHESHVLPSPKDERGGGLMLTAIPSHITRDGRDDRPEGGPWYPWLRLSFHLVKGDSMVLTKKQVIKLRDTLDQWIRKSAR